MSLLNDSAATCYEKKRQCGELEKDRKKDKPETGPVVQVAHDDAADKPRDAEDGVENTEARSTPLGRNDGGKGLALPETVLSILRNLLCPNLGIGLSASAAAARSKAREVGW